MVSFLVTNSLCPSNPKKFTVSIDRIIKPTGEPGTIFEKANSDDLFWELHIVAAESNDVNGDAVKSVWKDIVVGDENTISKLISAAILRISEQIDWTDGGLFSIEEDRYAPVVIETQPEINAENVSINQRIKVVIEDPLPGNGIDIGTIKFIVDGVEIVPDEIKGNPFRYELYYKPPIVYEEV